MPDDAPAYRSEFFKSPHHAWLGFLTLGAGFIAAQPLALIAGVTAYALGWIYLPDMPVFRNWLDRRRGAAARNAEQAEIAAFVQRRDAMVGSLTDSRRDRYHALAEVCASIESASSEPQSAADPADPRLRKLDELMWTFLRLLTIEQSLELFLETERREDVPAIVGQAEEEVQRLTAEVTALREKGASSTLDTKERFLASRVERLEVLRKRLERIRQAGESLALVVSEQERLEQQIKLIRADSIATKNAAALSARIDATVENLEATNQWLSQMDQFRDLITDLPQSGARVGFGVMSPPPIPQSAGARKKERA